MENEIKTATSSVEDCFNTDEVELLAKQMLDEYREAFLELAK